MLWEKEKETHIRELCGKAENEDLMDGIVRKKVRKKIIRIQEIIFCRL